MKALTKTAAIAFFTVVFGCGISPRLCAEELVKRSATVIGQESQKVGKLTYQLVNLRFEPKSSKRGDMPFETKFDITSTEITFVSATGRRRPATRAELKPGARVLVSGWTGISSTPTASKIQIVGAER